MTTNQDLRDVAVYTSGPFDDLQDGKGYIDRLRQVARWSEQNGCRGMLIYTDNHNADPWVLAQDIITHTESLCPLIAVQPVYMHPYSAAQKVSSIARVYGRAVDLNFVAGGFKFDLAALDDRVEHDARYERLAEYGTLMMRLLMGERVTLQGRYYRVFGLKLGFDAPPRLAPRITVSGSSSGGRKCANDLNAVAVIYPKPVDSLDGNVHAELSLRADDGLRTGIRVGILARPTSREAWREAEAMFPADDRGQAMRSIAVQTSDSLWLQDLWAASANHGLSGRSVYWLGPFGSGKSFCPYLVGSYDEVADYLSAYLRRGVRLIILDCPRDEQELAHACTAVRAAVHSASVQA